jgi:hypothetical protein
VVSAGVVAELIGLLRGYIAEGTAGVLERGDEPRNPGVTCQRAGG